MDLPVPTLGGMSTQLSFSLAFERVGEAAFAFVHEGVAIFVSFGRHIPVRLS